MASAAMLISIVEQWALHVGQGEPVPVHVESAIDQLEYHASDHVSQTRFDELRSCVDDLMAPLENSGAREDWNRLRQYVVDSCFLLRQSLLEPGVNTPTGEGAGVGRGAPG